MHALRRDAAGFLNFIKNSATNFQKGIDKLQCVWYTCKAFCFTPKAEEKRCLKRI